MAEYHDREHFIPIRKANLVDLLCRERDLSQADQASFRQLSDLLEATFHFEYHRQLNDLKNAYAPFDPDSDTPELVPLPPEQRGKNQEELFGKFAWLLERANYKKLPQETILAALEGRSDWGIDMDVDFELFERLDIYVRGDTVGKRSRRRMMNLWRLEEVELPIYQRLVFILKLRKRPHVDIDIDTDDVFLRTFKDIPKMDLEMLLPGSRVKMTRLDKGMIIYPLIAGLGILLYNVLDNIMNKGAALAAAGLFAGIGIWGAAGALGGYGYKSYHSYVVKKTTYSLKLTRSLYYQTIDINAGVVFRLLDEAEEQECREALLAYYFLWRHAGPDGWDSGKLDDSIEEYLEAKTGLKVDFEIGDALDKLKRLHLLEETDGGRVRAVPIDKALEALDYAWDNYFKYNNAAGDARTLSAAPG